MRYLKTFESFSKTLIFDFIYGRIDESEFISNLESLNENWVSDAFDKAKWKVIDHLFIFLEESKKIGFKIFSKVVFLLKWIWNKVKSFKEKYPTLFRICKTWN